MYLVLLVFLCSMIEMCLLFFFECYGYHRDLHVLTHSFPTRRSSDLAGAAQGGRGAYRRPRSGRRFDPRGHPRLGDRGDRDRRGEDRSEEHTSELQSLMRNSYAVFCLKKKKTKQNNKFNNSPTHNTKNDNTQHMTS